MAGYTLLELLVVLVIMALLVGTIPGVAVPMVDSFRFSGKIQAVAARLQEARDQAVASGQSVTLSAAALTDHDEVTLSPPGRAALVFYPDGSASGGVVSVSYAGRRRAMSINQVTGDIDGWQ